MNFRNPRIVVLFYIICERQQYRKVTLSDWLGWGPGGQAVNKTTNAVFLKHSPTGGTFLNSLRDL